MKRSTPLARRIPLRRQTPLRARTPLRTSGPPSATPRPARRAKRDPLYDAAKAAVAVRSRGRCEARTPLCTLAATEHHHRRRRRYDPDHETLIHVCWACHHEFIHSSKHAAEARTLGLLLPNIDVSGDDPWTPPGDREAA